MHLFRTDKQKFIALVLVAVIVTTFFPELIGLGVPHVFAASTNNDTILGDILFAILKPFHLLAGTAGSLMGVSAYYTVVDMGTLVGKVQPVVIAAWKLFRDIGNLLLVFGFMMIGIATILDSASYGAKKALPKLLIVAVMLNFSLFGAEFIVDTGNMFATQFYKQMNGGTLPATFSPSTEPISTAIMNNLGLTTIYKSATTQSGSPANMGAMARVLLFFMAIILFTVLAFVLGSIAIMLAARFVVLLFLLIVSPIGFIGLAGIPVVSNYGRKWWGAITNQTVFAPILFLFLLVVTKFANMGALIGGQQGGYANAASVAATTTGSGSLAAIILGFVITTGLLVASLMISKSLAGKTSSFGTRLAGKGMFGGMALANRYTLGLGANKLVNSSRFKNGIGRMPVVGRRMTNGLNRMATSSFDTRNGGIAGRILKAGGVDAGPAGGKGGYRKSYENKVKAREDHAAYLSKLTLDEREEAAAKKAEHDKAKDGQKAVEAAHKTEKENAERFHTAENTALTAEVKTAEDKLAQLEDANSVYYEGKEKDIQTAKANVETLQNLQKDKEVLQKRELADLEARHEAEQKAQQDIVNSAKVASDAAAGVGKKRARSYAEGQHEASQVFLGGKKGWDANREARMNIERTLGKDATQAQVDALMDQLKKNSESKSEEK